MKYSLENIRNYKQKQEIELNMLNIFIGENSSGKSTALRIIPLLQQSIGFELNRIEWYGENVDFGNEKHLKNRQDKPIKIGFNLSKEEMERFFRPFIPRHRELFKEGNIHWSDIKTNFELVISDDKIRKLILIGDEELVIDFDNRNNITKIGSIPTILRPRAVEYRYLIGTYDPSRWMMDERQNEMMENLEFNKVIFNINMISRYLSSLITNTTYIGPYRDYGDRYIRVKNRKIKKLDSNGENLISYLRSYKISELKNLNIFLENNFEFSVDIKSLYTQENTSLKLNIDNSLRNIVDLGSGYSQVLPIVINIFDALNSSRFETNIVIVEQPELHLHPKLQRQLSKIIYNMVKTGRKICVLIETHSTEIVYELADLEDLNGTNILNIYNCEKDERGSTLTKYVVSEDGTISWPKNFLM